jgi:putative endonuclease
MGDFFFAMPCYFYLLFSFSKDKFFLGHACGDLLERLKKHNSDHRGFTGGVGDWIGVYTERIPGKDTSLSERARSESMEEQKKNRRAH